MKHFIFTLFLVLSAATLSAATYYASPTGNGNGNTVNTPCSFLSGIKKLSAPGDTLYLLSGQYDLGNTQIGNLNGTSSRRIVIAGYDGINAQGTYPAILDFRTTPYGTRGLQIKSSCTYLHIKNLTLRYSGKNNLYNEGSNCLFENLDIYGSADTGCQMKNGGNSIIKNVDSHDNFDYETMSGTTANFGGNADGFADKQHSGGPNTYIGCRAWNNSDDGWDFFQRASTGNTIIENCICYMNGAPFYDMRNHGRYQTDKSWFDSKVGTTMTDRYGNTITITLEQYPNQGNGNGFKMGGNYTNHLLEIHHCFAVGNYARGFDQNNNDGTMWVYNNTSYLNQTNYGFTTAYGTSHLRNNISFSSKSTDSYRAKTVGANDHNTWNSGYSVSKADFQSLDTTLILAPRQSDGSLPVNAFLRLANGSALKDAGADVNLGYDDAAPDLGCYEVPGTHHDPEPPEPEDEPVAGQRLIAYVTTPNAAADKVLISHLKTNKSLFIRQTDASDNSVDYSGYDVIVLGPVPASSAAGFTPLKGYNKPMLVLKPFLFKSSVWNWGNSVNTSDLSISVKQVFHPLLRGLVPDKNNELALFSACNTNAVTAISTWTNTAGFDTIATPVSQPSYTTIADFPAGTNCNGTVLPQRLVMIGVSEYSTANLTSDGVRLIENAILYLLKDSSTDIEHAQTTASVEATKVIRNGQIYILKNGQYYTLLGTSVQE